MINLIVLPPLVLVSNIITSMTFSIAIYALGNEEMLLGAIGVRRSFDVSALGLI